MHQCRLMKLWRFYLTATDSAQCIHELQRKSMLFYVALHEDAA